MSRKKEGQARYRTWIKSARILVSILGLCCSLVVAALAWVSFDGDEQRMQAASDQRLLAHSAGALAAQVQEAFGRMDHVAGSFVAADVAARDRSQLTAKVIRAMGLLPEAGKVSVFDASGQLLASSQITSDPAGQPERLSRGAFRELLASPPDRLRLHALPATSGSDDVMVSARRIEDGHDQLAGLVAITIKPAALRAMLTPEWLPQGVSADLLLGAPERKDGEPDARSPDRGKGWTDLLERWLPVEQPRRQPAIAIAPLPAQNLRVRAKLDPAGQLGKGGMRAAERSPWPIVALLSSGVLAFLSGSLRPADRRSRDRRIAELEAELRSAAATASTLQGAVHEARRSRDLVLASVGHDVRTLLTSIGGFAMLLLESDLEEQQRGWTETLLASTQTLLDMVNGLLEVASGNSGQRELHVDEVDVVGVIKEASRVLDRQAREKDLNLRVHLSPELDGIWRLDLTRLRQVLLNLVVNAIKYTSRGDVTVSACVLSRETEAMETSSRTTIQIRVADTGPGIPEADRVRIFGEFQRGSLHENERGSGLGLGLAICKANADLMGGVLDFETEIGVGTEFRFELPAERLRDVPRAMPFAGRVCLVVGFTDGDRRRLSRQLEDSGFDVETAADGYIGLGVAERTIAASARIDLVVVDGNMSLLSTADFIDRLRKIPAVELARIAWVGTSEDGGVEAARPRADAFVAPPGKAEEVLAAVAEVMDGAPAHETARPPADSHDGGRILVVEDNEAIQRLLVTFLSSQGFSVFTVDNGEDAVRAASRGGVDAILMDLQLPGVDGCEATRRIRGLGGPLAAVPIVGQTALTGERVQRKCRDAGMTSVVAKPPDLHDLCRILRTDIANARRATLYSELSTGPEAEIGPVMEPIIDGSRGMIEAMVESFGASHARSFVENRAIELRLKAHHLVELVPAWEVTAIQRTCAELAELASGVGALPLMTLLAKARRTVEAGDRARAEAAAAEIEEHANRLGPALMLCVNGGNPKLNPLES